MANVPLKFFSVLCALSVLCGCVTQQKDSSDVLEVSIGKLVSLHDRHASYARGDNPFGSAKTFVLFKELYVYVVSKESESVRSDYFWASMWHLGFDGDYMKQFQEIVYQDLGEKFIDRLQNYVDKESKFSRSETKLFLSQKVLLGLNEMRNRERNH